MVPGMREEKMDGGEGIFLMEREEAEWMDCFKLDSFFLSLFQHLLSHLHLCTMQINIESLWMDGLFPLLPPPPHPPIFLSLLQHLLKDFHKGTKQKNM